jgi:hypothetical protein
MHLQFCAHIIFNICTVWHQLHIMLHSAVTGFLRLWYNIILLNTGGGGESFISWDQIGEKYKSIAFNFFWFIICLIIRSYCTKQVEWNGLQGAIRTLVTGCRVCNLRTSNKCNITKYCMKTKIWMSCLERPINISGVNRSELLKTEEAVVRVRDVVEEANGSHHHVEICI